ncbi:hypothetical protein SKAU_G00277640 [Synaphobranchus kaupii]|uniref:Uncharacterized protein n=1 Tax=Synaphobranchus kaupii TaxID=118154 RepID=A0A9Q1EWK0_SYNKA|nr:hypothetical protein SKAU_G00277640 [Synaphobranchus kaupii]
MQLSCTFLKGPLSPPSPESPRDAAALRSRLTPNEDKWQAVPQEEIWEFPQRPPTARQHGAVPCKSCLSHTRAAGRRTSLAPRSCRCPSVNPRDRWLKGPTHLLHRCSPVISVAEALYRKTFQTRLLQPVSGEEWWREMGWRS